MSEVGLEIRFDGEPYLATRENTILFTHFGELAVYDHVYMIPVEGFDGLLGGYMWSDHQHYAAVEGFVRVHNFMQHLNLSKVADNDKLEFKRSHPNGLYLPTADVGLPEPNYEDLEDLYFGEGFPGEWTED